MPSFDQKGPVGQGPMTGRKMGRCTNYGVGKANQVVAESNVAPENTPENFARGFGFGRGQGGRGSRGRGLGMQNRFRSGF